MNKFLEKRCDCSLPLALATPFQPHSNWSFRKHLSPKLNTVRIKAGLEREKKLRGPLGMGYKGAAKGRGRVEKESPEELLM